MNNKTGTFTFRICRYCLFICLLFSLISGICLSVFPPSKLSGENNTVVIDDRINVLGDTTALRQTLTEFKEKTGIAPMILTVYNSTWQGAYSNLEDYAYNAYIDYFGSDETHWLIVYSRPAGISGEYNDWFWEGVQGNDTDRILNKSVLEPFNENMQKYLSDMTFYTPADAIRLSFEQLIPTTMKSGLSNVSPWAMMFVVVIESAVIVVVVRTIKKLREERESKVSDNQEQKKLL